jgi:hypothetical protein
MESKRGPKTEEFLLAEYRNLADSFWRNEDAGERRVNFFITLVTAVISALVALATRATDLRSDVVSALVIFALLALLAFGVITLLRMMRRNRATDEYKRAMAQVRKFFKEEDERLRDYQPFPKSARTIGSGGLAEMVAVFNALIVAALGVVLAISLALWMAALAGVVCFVAAIIVQFRFIASRYAEK